MEIDIAADVTELDAASLLGQTRWVRGKLDDGPTPELAARYQGLQAELARRTGSVLIAGPHPDHDTRQATMRQLPDPEFLEMTRRVREMTVLIGEWSQEISEEFDRRASASWRQGASA